MSNLFSRAEALTACARTTCRKLTWVFAWVLAAPMAHAADPMPMPADTVTAPSLGKYQNWRDEPPQDWREANDRVGEIGGWLTYIREAQEGEGGAGQGMHDPHHHHGH